MARRIKTTNFTCRRRPIRVLTVFQSSGRGGKRNIKNSYIVKAIDLKDKDTIDVANVSTKKIALKKHDMIVRKIKRGGTTLC